MKTCNGCNGEFTHTSLCFGKRPNSSITTTTTTTAAAAAANYNIIIAQHY